jgi:hypothetical protein
MWRGHSCPPEVSNRLNFLGCDFKGSRKLKQVAVGRVPLDKSEGAVKGVEILGGAQAPPGLPERLRTKTLEISR